MTIQIIACLAYFSQILEEELDIFISGRLGIVWYEIMQIVIGLHSTWSQLRERLLREAALTFEKIIKLCRIREQSNEQSKISILPATNAEAQHRRCEEDRAIDGHNKIQKRRLAKNSEIESLSIFWKASHHQPYNGGKSLKDMSARATV